MIYDNVRGRFLFSVPQFFSLSRFAGKEGFAAKSEEGQIRGAEKERERKSQRSKRRENVKYTPFASYTINPLFLSSSSKLRCLYIFTASERGE